MNEIERAIQIIERQKLQIGIDYTNGKDLTAICLVGNSAETALTALREQAERIKGCDFCLDPDGDNCDNGLYIDHTNRPAITTHDIYVPIDYCPMCGRHLTKEEV